ncbi:hypothetical protein [Fulvivirga lutea]|uniref:Uncharacterized protein n=1 Tax=Fulvivirga lutea TaxID=2810512 RepID=A0A975A283_9BACT|nr:hypothetical protein [Fulvivirga lutea]QSE99025.1 hypothetical protein JR347_08045 [Fulvivirga lutea]
MKKFSIYMLCVMTLIATGCGDDDESGTPQLGVVEAKESMDDFSDDLTTDIVSITQSEGIEAVGELFSLTSLSDPFNGRVDHESTKEWFKNRAASFKTIFSPKKVGFSRTDEDGFNFAANVGVYEWNASIEEFEKTSSEGQIIVIKFPAEGSATNNAQLRITSFEEEQFEDEFEVYYMPTDVSADLSVDGTKQIELVFSAEYNNDGDPISGTISLFLMPYTFAISVDDSSSASTTANFTIKEGVEVIMSTSTKIIFVNTAKEEVKNLEGAVTYRSLKISGNINVEGIESSENVDYNNFVKLVLFDNNNKIGDIVFVTEIEDGEEYDVAYVKYADGSKEKLEDILAPVIEEFESFEDEVETWG